MIVKAEEKDAAALASLAVKLWGAHSLEELELAWLLKNPEAAVFMEVADGIAVGFAQCQLRHDYVEGTKSSPVGYLEGIYVCPSFRRRGIAGKLLAQCQRWAGGMGCTEFASDCQLDNAESLLFHKRLGFQEANRIICFTKRL